MDVSGQARLLAPAGRTFEVVSDLATYPQWLGIVRSVQADGEGWFVELGAKVGPFWRTKRVRMERTEHDPPKRVRFERREHDGREHSAWILDATVDGPELTMHLHYGGGGPLAALLEPALRQEIKRAGGRLEALLT